MSSDKPGKQPERSLLAVGTDSYESQEFARLSEVREALRNVVQTLKGMGFSPVSRAPGYRVNPTLKIMRDVVREAALAAPVVVVYYTGHGVQPDQDHYYLVGKKSQPANYAGTALPAAELLNHLTVRDDHGYPLADQPLVLLILDCCYSGSAGMELLGESLRGIGNHRTWVIASAGALEYAQQNLFAKAFCDALERPTAGPSQRFIGLDSLVQAINDSNAGRAEQQARVFPPPTGSTGIPSFFPNKQFVPGLAGLTVDEQHWLSRVLAGPEEMTVGSYLTGKGGRTLAAQHLVSWITDPGSQRLALVTGSPGTGKSTLLSLPVLLTQPSRRKTLLRSAGTRSIMSRTAALLPVGTPLIALHARGLNTNQAASLVARALGRNADSADALLSDLDTRPPWPNQVVVVDALDEATSPSALLGGLVMPLSRQPGMRVVVGARRHVLPDASDADLTIDLDTSQYQDPQALTDYVRRLLVADQEPSVTTPYQYRPGRDQTPETAQIAAAIARKATSRDSGAQSFLLGRLFALSARGRAEPVDVKSPGWQTELPNSIAEAFEEDLARLGNNRPRAVALLAALAWARGPGLPWETIWALVAEATGELNEGSDLTLTSEDVRWLLAKAGAYIVEDIGPGERSVYRPFHDLLAAHLRGEPSTEQRLDDPAAAAAWEQRRVRTEEAITRALLEAVPTGPTGRRDWQLAHPYLRTYLAQHAAASGVGVLADLVADRSFLAVADPLTLTPLLAPTIPELRDIARAYRRARPQFGEDVRANSAYLLEAERAVTGVESDPTDVCPLYHTHLAVVRTDESLLTLTGHSGGVTSVAFGTTSDGRLLLASAGQDKTVRIWDPLTGNQVGDPLAGHAGGVTSVAFGTTSEGRLLLASAGMDKTVKLWEPMVGSLLASFTGHAAQMTSVAFGTTSEGRLLLAFACSDGTLRLFDPITGNQVGDPLAGSWGSVTAVACINSAYGRPLLASVSSNTVRLWTATGALKHQFIVSGASANTAAFGRTAQGNTLLAYGGAYSTVEIWDIATNSEAEKVEISCWGVTAVAFGSTEWQQLLLATASSDGTVEVWDTLTGVYGRVYSGRPLIGHTGEVTSVAFGASAGRQLLLASGGDDGTVRVWDPVSEIPASGRAVDYPGRAKTVAFGTTVDGQILLASASGDGRIWLSDPVAGIRTIRPITGHTGSVTSVAFGTTAEGQLLLASASDDGKVWLWDPIVGTRVRDPLTGHTGSVTSVAFGTTHDGQLLLASGSDDATVRIWDPATGSNLESFAGHTRAVTSVSFGQFINGRVLLASGSKDKTVRLWDPVSGTGTPEQVLRHSNSVSSVTFGITEDKQLILASAGEDGAIHLWDTLTAASLGDPLTRHSDDVTSLAIGAITGPPPLVASASDDRTVRLWDLGSRELITILRRRSRVKSIAINGPLLAVGDDEGVSVMSFSYRE